MPVSEEGNSPSAKPAVTGSPEQNPSGKNDTVQQEPGLPGLAEFGGLQGYAPVTGQPQAGARAAEPEPEPELPASYEKELVADFLGQETGHHSENTEPEYTDPAIQEAGAPAAEPEPVPEPEPEPVLPASFGEEHVADVPDQEPASPSEDTEHQYADAGIQETGAEAAYVPGEGPDAQDDHQNYIPEQDPAPGVQPDATLYDDAGSDGGGELHDDAGTSMQTFEAHYDQHPEIPLDAFANPGQEQTAQPFFHETGHAGDAEFMGGEIAPETAEPKERRGRRILMAASSLIGVLALGGALAFAYKIGGESDIASTVKPPLIQADIRPVKRAPDKPGGKQFPHKNKKIYERLQGSASREVERIVPRQEKIAPAATAAINGMKPALDSGTQPPGGPRKVRTLSVRPDGTIEAVLPRQKIIKAPPPPAAAPEPSKDGGTGIALSLPQVLATTPPAVATNPAVQTPVEPDIPKPVVVLPPPAAPQKVEAAPQKVEAEPQKVEAVPLKVAAAPPPVQKPPVPRAAPASAPRRTAAPAASASEYVVQVASRKSQMEALATYADIQQKFPRLLSGYRPIVKRTDLGSKGVWYRLNVGPIESRKVASALCGQLKSAGMRSCIVRVQ